MRVYFSFMPQNVEPINRLHIAYAIILPKKITTVNNCFKNLTKKIKPLARGQKIKDAGHQRRRPLRSSTVGAAFIPPQTVRKSSEENKNIERDYILL